MPDFGMIEARRQPCLHCLKVNSDYLSHLLIGILGKLCITLLPTTCHSAWYRRIRATSGFCDFASRCAAMTGRFYYRDPLEYSRKWFIIHHKSFALNSIDTI
jgi:hypothetical protein